MQKDQRATTPSARAGRVVLAAGCLLGLVLIVTWPWGADLAHSFADHWDPPLHAWKVWNMAEAILHGRLLPPGTSLNAFYPSAGSLYYESLYWPQGVLAAPVLAASGNPVLAFHASYLFFWILSGLCFGALLRELGAGRAAAAFGAAVFAILPVRTGYVVEFNMQLGFGPPLVLLLLLRWSRSRRPALAAAAAAALCLQATSEMYTAVFFGLCLPFVLAALAGGRVRELLEDRRTWFSITAAAGVAAGVAAAFFLPYLGQLGNSVSRPLEEVARHEAEPLSYLASSLHMARRLVPEPFAKQDELCLYPTLAVIVLAAAFAAFRFRARRRDARSAAGRRRAESVLRTARAAALLLFLAEDGLCAATGRAPSSAHGWLPVPVVLLSLAIPFVSAYRDDRDRLLDGLFGGAVFAFFLSLGPFLFHAQADWTEDNVLFLFLRERIGFLEGFRVVSRFGMVVLLFLATAAALALGRIAAGLRSCKSRTGRATALLAWPVAFACVLAESVPLPVGHRPADPIRSPVLDRLDGRPEPFCLLLHPAWDRYYDSDAMFRIGGTKRLLAASWGGAYPPFSLVLKQHFRQLGKKPGRFRYTVWSIWPECLILLDREHLAAYHPAEESARAAVRDLEAVADRIDEDARFALYRIHRRPAAAEAVKRVRPDLADRLRRCEFRATPEDGAPLALSLERNGVRFFETVVPGGGASFEAVSPDVPSDPVEPDLFRFSADRPFTLDGFRLLPNPDPRTP